VSTSKEFNEKQRQADKKHHEDRIKWLTGEKPRWGCGTPVSKHEVLQMLNASRSCLVLINEHGMSTNSASV